MKIVLHVLVALALATVLLTGACGDEPDSAAVRSSGSSVGAAAGEQDETIVKPVEEYRREAETEIDESNVDEELKQLEEEIASDQDSE